MGTVSLSWSVFRVDSIPTVRLIWQERGGSMSAPLAKPGFGTSVLKRVAPSTVGGEAELLYGPQGCTWILKGPLEGFSPVAVPLGRAPIMALETEDQDTVERDASGSAERDASRSVEQDASGSNIHVLYADRGSGNR